VLSHKNFQTCQKEPLLTKEAFTGQLIFQFLNSFLKALVFLLSKAQTLNLPNTHTDKIESKSLTNPNLFMNLIQNKKH
jgi:hypothetical protein